MRQLFLPVAVATIALTHVGAQSPAAPAAFAQRIVHTDPAVYRPLSAVHGGAGNMSFTALLNRGALTPELTSCIAASFRRVPASATTFTTSSRRCSSSSTAKRSSRSTAAPPP